MSLLKRFAKNETGRDFVVGDIHGCFDKLRAELDRVGFKEDADRLFSVGDLVDRGPHSEEAVEWVGYPWFHAVRGNHEEMAIGVASGKHDHGLYCLNGGGWFVALEPTRQKEIADAFESLPVAIEVELKNGKAGIIHAEVPGGDWKAFCDQIVSPISNNKRKHLMEFALWSRDKIARNDDTHVAGIDYVFVGHTPVDHPRILGNVHYIDTGAVYQRHLTMVEIS